MLNLLLFLGTYFSGFILALFSNPAFSFVLYEAVYFFYPQRRWWGSMVPDLRWSFFTVVLMLFIYVFNYKKFNVNKLLSVPQFVWFYLFLFILGITYFYAVLPDAHSRLINTFFKLAIIISVAYKLCDSAEKLNYVLFGYIYGAWYVGFVAYQTGRNQGDRVEHIGTVDAPDSNGISAAIAPALVLCLHYFWITKNLYIKILFVIAGVFIANGLVLINSRGAFLGAAVSIFYYMFFMYTSPFQRKYQKSMAVFITIAGISGALYLADDSFISRMSTITSSEVSEERETGATRTAFWAAAWEMSKDYPMGKGSKAFEVYAPQYIASNVNTGRSRNRAVHSTWFEVLTEVGYIGLFFFIMMLYSSLKMASKCKKVLKKDKKVDDYFKMIAIEGAFIGFLVIMTFLNRMRAEVLYWLILYTACAYNIYVLKHKTEKSSP